MLLENNASLIQMMRINELMELLSCFKDLFDNICLLLMKSEACQPEKMNVKRAEILTTSCFEITQIPDTTGSLFCSFTTFLLHEPIRHSAMSALKLCIFLLVIGALVSDHSVNGNIQRRPIGRGRGM